MDGWIGNLSGFFDGYHFINGPLSVLVEDGKIRDISDKPISNLKIDARSHLLLPSFVDGHTHLIFGGTRFDELALKLEGKTYNDILAQGGGIQSTVKSTRAASSKELETLVVQRLDAMMSYGSLTVEIKSGYGLSSKHEIRLLEVLNKIDHPVKIVPTFGAAHVVPPEVTREDYINEIIDVMLPEVVNKSLATSTDVFCDKGAFTVDETLRIFNASQKLGLPVKVHAEELEYTGIARIASEQFSLLSADHLLHATNEDFTILEENNCVSMFMPLAPFGLFTDQLPKGFLETDVTIGIGSDFNPNNWAVNIQSAIRMAVFRYRIPPLQAVKAATTGSFQGLFGAKRDKLQIGSSASFLLVRASTVSEFVSKFGQNLVRYVFKNGELVHSNDHLMI